jgi:hypothetical protein
MSISGGPDINERGLVLYLDAGNSRSYPGSGDIWSDLSGNNNNITLANSPVYSSDGSFTFNGTSTSGSIASNSSLTITTPTFIVGCTVATGTVFAKGGFGNYWNYGLTTVTSTNFSARNNQGDLSSSTPFTTGSGLNVYACVYNGSAVEFYRNGIFGGTQSTNYSPSAINQLFVRIGCAFNNNTQTNVEFYNGKIYFIQLYNRILTSQEILQNFNATRSRFGI